MIISKPASQRKRMAFFSLLLILFSFNLLSQSVTVSGAVSGNGSYADLNSAFAAINGGTQTSANILVDISASITETASAVLNAGAWTTLSVTPSGGSPRTVTGDIAGALIDLNGADNVFISGLNTGGNALTISNTNTLNILTSTIRFVEGASSNTITNCSILGSSTSATLGTVTFSTATAAGNNSNIISLCSIGAAGANTPVNGIYSGGSSGFINTGNTVQGCNILDYFNSSQATRGLLVAANSAAWNISGNRFYQTALRTYTTSNTHGAIQVVGGDNYTVSNNIIGYSSSSSTGNYAMTSTIASLFVGISISAGTVTPSSVQGNTITAITLTTSSSAATGNGILCGISISGGNVNIGNLASNIIGGITGTDLIYANPTTSGGTIVGINSSSTGTILIQNNYIAGLTSTGLTAAVGSGCTGINISGLATGLSVISNTIGNPTPNSMRCGTSTLTTANSSGSGISYPSTLTATNIAVSNNIIQNLSSWGTGTGGYVRGIWGSLSSGTGVFSINNNTITNLTSNNSNATVGTGQIGTAGIIMATGTSCTLSGNYISNIANTGTATTHIIVSAFSNANGTNTVYKENKIYNITNTSPGTTATGPPVAAGFFIRSGTSGLTIVNNFISLGSGQTSNTSFIGIFGQHGSTPNPTVQAYYNTINIQGTVTSGSNPSFGVLRSDFSTSAKVAPFDIRNNLITNTRTGGTGSHYAIANNYGAAASSTTGWGPGASNYNVLNADPLTVGWWTSALSFSGWKSASAGDGASYSGITVNYVNSATDLHLNMGTTPTYIESGGQAIAGITTDIDSQVRPGPAGSVNGGAIYPDIGADEIDGAIVTCTTSNAGVLSPASGTACSGQTLAIASASANTAFNNVFQWKYATAAGGPYTNVPGGSGANTPTYTSAPLNAGTFYIVLQSTCTSASVTSVSNEVTLTVSSSPTVSASVSAPVVCAGQSVSLTGATNGTTVLWTGPSSFTSTSLSQTINPTTVANNGSYAFVATGNGCSSLPAIVNLTVLPAPVALTVTPLTASICTGSSATLAVTNGTSATLSFTPQTNQNTATSYPAPYTAYYGGQKMQFLVLASELSNAGITAGPLTSLQFPVVSLGANWGTSITSNQGFQISIGHTTLSATQGTFETGLTVVSASTNYTPTVGFNVHTFGTPFNWNGTSNIIVETIFSNNFSGASADAVISYNSPTTFQSTMVYRVDSTPFSTIAAATTTNIATTLIRPDFKITGIQNGTYTWSPSSGLSATSGNSVVASPSLSTTYTVQTSIGSCSASKSVAVQVIPMPTLSIVSSTNTVCAGDPATLTASGASTYTWNTTASGSTAVVNPSVNTVYTASNVTGTCPMVTASISIAANPVPTLVPVMSSASICAGQSATLSVSGASTYVWNPGGTGSLITVSPATSIVYNVAGTSSLGCSSSATLALTVNQLPTITIVSSTSAICLGSSTSLFAGGANSYSWNTGPTGSVIVVSPTLTTNYTVTGTDLAGCTNTAAAGIQVNPLPAVNVSPASLTICAGGTANFTASGAATYSWNTGATTATVAVSPSVQTSFTVTGTDQNGCAADATASVDFYPMPSIVIAQSASSVCLTSPVTFTAVSAAVNTYSWSTGGTGSVITIVPAGSSVYTLTAVTAGSCVTTKTVSVSTLTLPVIVASPSSATVCVDDVTSLTVSGAASYTLAPGNVSSGAFTINPAANTVYTITGTDANGCTNMATSDITVNACTGIAKNAGSNAITVFPNPSTGIITASFGFEGTKEIFITNPVGAVVGHSSTDLMSQSFDLSGMAKGIYFISIQHMGATANYKVVIQ